MRPPEEQRAWVRLPSGRRLDLISPTPFDWTDEDLAIGLSRTFRWGGHSIWPGAPLSVAQHSLAVLALRRAKTRGGLTEAEARKSRLAFTATMSQPWLASPFGYLQPMARMYSDRATSKYMR